MDLIVGIDLGTTNSEIAYIRDGRAVVIEEDGQPILPSAVALDREGNLLVGEAARNQALLAPDRTILSIKRRMGQPERVKLGSESYTPQEISAMILRTLKARAEKALGQRVSKAVITVPAYFKEAQREATREAGELAGLEVVRIINEPTAAALIYEPNPDGQETVLVYDLGGGTFDVSIVRLEQDVVEVLASHGDTHLGGDDMDALLFEHVRQAFLEQTGVDLASDARARSRAVRAVEDAKKRLSTEAITRVRAEFVAEKAGEPIHLDMEVDRRTYEGLIQPLIDRTLKCLDKAMTDANLRAEQIDKVIIVGGATRTPLVRAVLEARLGQPVHEEVEPDLCVAMGAAIQGGLIAGVEVGRVLVDITPHTLGVSVTASAGGVDIPFHFAPIIRRNTPLPASRTELFSIPEYNQGTIIVPVMQGEDPDSRNNTEIGELTVTDIDLDSADKRVPVRFDLDLNGMLTVTITQSATGRSEKMTIESALKSTRNEDRDAARRRIDDVVGAIGPDGLIDDEAGEGMASEQMEIIDEATNLLGKARVLLESADGDDAADLTAIIDAVARAISDRDIERIQQVMPELEDLVFYMEEA